jgi:hypothetical protein
MKNLKAAIILSLIYTMTMGCSGQMDGVIRRDAKRIKITYTNSKLATAELMVVLPDGEQFNGQSERFDREKDMKEKGSVGIEDQYGNFEALQTFNGNSMATLSGSRGNVIKCRFKVADAIIGFSSGGAGLCQISDGRVIDVFF